jgi:pimeloyl-ACP methyl ester carboxylesterase
MACSPVAPQKIDLEPCQIGNIAAQCGKLSVYENRSTKQGRKIDIHVAVIKARGANPAPDPVFYLAGGPGGSAINGAPYALKLLGLANEQRDIVLVDQRGTGKSNRLVCPRQADEAAGQAPLSDAMLSDLRACLETQDGDPSAYTTAWGMDDLDDVRAALGYDKINLYGESYGPTAGQVYVQRHGAHVRTLAMEGVTLLDVPMFEQMPRSSQQVLELLFTRCAADAACSTAYPNLREETAAVIAQLEKQPVELPLTDPHSGKPVMFSRELLVTGIHGMIMSTEQAVQLPFLIHQLYQGKWEIIAQLYSESLNGDAPAPTWQMMNLTILCHEDWAKLRPEETARSSERSYLTYADARRITVPEEVCASIPRPVPSALHKPLGTAPVPVLIISNEADPQNAPENVAGAKEHYPNSLVLVAPGQGHGYTGIACRERIIASFIEEGSIEGVNADCLQQEPLPPFYIAK